MKSKQVIKPFLPVVIFLPIVVGCVGLSDYDLDLPVGYSIIRSSGDDIHIATKEGNEFL